MFIKSVNSLLEGKGDLMQLQIQSTLVIQSSVYYLVNRLMLLSLLFLLAHQGLWEDMVFTQRTTQRGASQVLFSGAQFSANQGHRGGLYDAVDVSSTSHQQESVFVASSQMVDLN